MNKPRRCTNDASDALHRILQGELGFHLDVRQAGSGPDREFDFVVEATARRAKFCFGVKALSRITPEVALSVLKAIAHRRNGPVPVLYAPVVSPRVAEIARAEGVSYIDRAGNCRLMDRDRCVFIERRGLKTARQQTPPASDPFAPKSSRIVRALLSRPMKGWQVRELAQHPEIGASPGLVVKVKRALIEEGYTIERERRLYLRDPIGLLNAWSREYAGPTEAVPLFCRGDLHDAEQTVARWCEENALHYALAGYSAAWRLAPEVRYNVASFFLEDRGFGQIMLQTLGGQGVRRVDTGPNLYLWRPFDESVFVGSERSNAAPAPMTSPIQTYLDLKRTAGRGEEAAQAVYEKYLLSELSAASERANEWSHAAV